MILTNYSFNYVVVEIVMEMGLIKLTLSVFSFECRLSCDLQLALAVYP